MNLINDPWIPVRRADNSRGRIRPAQIVGGESPVVAFDAPRPDFNGALAQFLIGLLQTVAAPAHEDEWSDWLERPPTEAWLTARFATVAHAFNLDGDGPCFMQDLDPQMGGNAAQEWITSLLIDAPTSAAIKKGTDHFQKRISIQGFCHHCTAMALFTLHTNAPAGGAGHRTSLRGGGPLTTLVAPNGEEEAPIWSLLWLNVLEQPVFLADWPPGSDRDWFPWLSETRTSKNGEVITAADAHPAMAYWAMPRRIRLDARGNEKMAHCDVCGQESTNLVTHFLSRPHGMNCSDWLHPLSPYYADKQGLWLPTHPQPGGIGYRHWPDLITGREGVSRPAKVVGRAMQRWEGTQQLWSFGYDMDNMKARCWYEARLPLLAVPNPEHRERVAGLASKLVEAATVVKDALQDAVRSAWFSPHNKNRGDTGFLTLAFWQKTEADFYALLWRCADALALQNGVPEETHVEIMGTWHRVLCQGAVSLFDQWVTTVALEFEDPGRIARAHHQLQGRLHGPNLKE